MALYNETRQDETPTVKGLGGGNIAVDWQKNPSSIEQTGQMMQTIMTSLEQEETKKQKKLNDKFDTYKVLRDAGYDARSAYQAMNSGDLPTAAPDTSLDDQKKQADLIKSQADSRLATAKADAYDRGDIGKSKAKADKMNAAQLQREIKRVSDPFENPDYDSEETKSYQAYLNQKLQQISQYPGAQAPADEPLAAEPAKSPVGQIPQGAPTATDGDAAKKVGRIRVQNLKTGAFGTISAKNFDPKKYKRA